MCYIILSIYALSMLWENLLQFVTIKTWSRNFFNIWRAYDLVMKIGLLLALIFRAIRVKMNQDILDVEALDDNDNDTILEKDWIKDYLNTMRHLERGEVVLMANITTMAVIRYNYLQLCGDGCGIS